MWTILKHWLIFAYRRIVSETPPAKHHKFLFGPPRSTRTARWFGVKTIVLSI